MAKASKADPIDVSDPIDTTVIAPVIPAKLATKVQLWRSSISRIAVEAKIGASWRVQPDTLTLGAPSDLDSDQICQKILEILTAALRRLEKQGDDLPILWRVRLTIGTTKEGEHRRCAVRMTTDGQGATQWVDDQGEGAQLDGVEGVRDPGQAAMLRLIGQLSERLDHQDSVIVRYQDMLEKSAAGYGAVSDAFSKIFAGVSEVMANVAGAEAAVIGAKLEAQAQQYEHEEEMYRAEKMADLLERGLGPLADVLSGELQTRLSKDGGGSGPLHEAWATWWGTVRAQVESFPGGLPEGALDLADAAAQASDEATCKARLAALGPLLQQVDLEALAHHMGKANARIFGTFLRRAGA